MYMDMTDFCSGILLDSPFPDRMWLRNEGLLRRKRELNENNLNTTYGDWEAKRGFHTDPGDIH